MRYKEKYPEAVEGDRPEKHLLHSGRFYPCDFPHCRAPTPWRDLSEGCEVPLCSEECKEGAKELWENS